MYFLLNNFYFFTDHWAAELILATTNHDVETVYTAAGDIELGDAWLLPLTLPYNITSLLKEKRDLI